MKKLFFFAIVALGMTAACQKPDAPVDETNEPVAIQFGVQAPTLTVTKTKAAVDDWTGDQEVTIYGYKKNDVSTILLNGVTGTVAQSTNPDTDPATADEGSITFDEQPYYEGTTVYDFRAIYTGDAVVGEATTGTTISQTVTIDGDDDIMHAVTDYTNDILNPDLSDNETLNENRVYSAYAARRNVHPSLVFSHKLTRFAFNVTKGNSSDDALPVKVTGIKVKSQNTGTLYIAGGENEGKFTPTGDPVELSIKDFQTITPTEDPTPAGEIMVFPVTGADEFIEITLALEATGHTVQPMTVKLTPKMVSETNTEFAAGKKYNVTFTVYGLEKIKVTAKLTEWVSGGDASYDPDKYWEAE